MSWSGIYTSLSPPDGPQISAVVRFQYDWLQNRVSNGKSPVSLDELANAGIQYCIQLSSSDLSYCDDLALWLFVQISLIGNLIGNDPVYKDQSLHINRFISQCTMASPWSKQFNIVTSELVAIKNGDKKLRVQSELYPNESDQSDDGDDDDYTNINMNDLSLDDEILEMSISDLKSHSLEKVQFINIQDREFHLPGLNIINLNSTSHLSSIEINGNCNLIVFFTRSESISKFELEIYRQLSSNTHLPPSYWLTGGYKSFKLFFNSINHHHQQQPQQQQQQQIEKKNLMVLPLIPQPRQSLQGAPIPNIYNSNNNYHYNQQDQQSTIKKSITTPSSSSLLTSNASFIHPKPLLPITSLNNQSSPRNIQNLQEFSDMPPPLISLPNYGSTCYINSMIQCLFRLDYFRKYFLKLNIMDLKTSMNPELTIMFKNLFESFYKISTQSNLPPTINIISLLKIINSKNPNLNIPNEQQDTSQFLYTLLNDLHVESKTDLKIIPNFNGNEQLREWYKSTLLMEDGFSKIQDFFQIINEIQMKCTRCGYSSIKYETSNVLHLNLKNLNNSKLTTLNQIIQNNLINEEMSERLGNAWDCDGCNEIDKRMKKLAALVNTESNEQQQALQQQSHQQKKTKFKMFKSKNESKSRQSTPIDLRYMTEKELDEYENLSSIITKPRIANRIFKFVKLPDILIVCFTIFDPFHPDAKINTDNLNFPVDLSLTTSDHMIKNYKLKARIDHLGSSIESGHYTAIVLSEQNRTWVECDDEKLSTVSPVNSQILHDKNVYLLFYESIPTS